MLARVNHLVGKLTLVIVTSLVITTVAVTTELDPSGPMVYVKVESSVVAMMVVAVLVATD